MRMTKKLSSKKLIYLKEKTNSVVNLILVMKLVKTIPKFYFEKTKVHAEKVEWDISLMTLILKRIV